MPYPQAWGIVGMMRLHLILMPNATGIVLNVWAPGRSSVLQLQTPQIQTSSAGSAGRLELQSPKRCSSANSALPASTTCGSVQ